MENPVKSTGESYHASSKVSRRGYNRGGMDSVPSSALPVARDWRWALWFASARLLTRLPVPLWHAAGALAGLLLSIGLPRRRSIAAANLRLCFPHHSTADRARLLRAHFRAYGIGLLETALAWQGTERQIARLPQRLEGLEHLQAALARGRGVLLLSAHFTPLELGWRLLARVQPLSIMYRRQPNPWLNARMCRARERHLGPCFENGDREARTAALAANRVVWYGADQDYGTRHSVFAPFFGAPAATIAALGAIVRRSGAAVLPGYAFRAADGAYVMRLLPVWSDFPGASTEADARRINAFIEDAVRAAPEQWYWLHRRFKTRPAGAAGVYD
jgi:KDO2-lipid IV(A) lauroyltransferase